MRTNQINERLRIELLEWFRKQCQNLSDYYYLYYLESNSCHDGGFIICKDPPPNREYKKGSNQHIFKNNSREQNFNYFRPIINQLPIIEEN
jgi:hypothetical protein